MRDVHNKPTRTTRRPVALRMRSDLVAHERMVAGSRWWCVKDPVSLKYFHLRDEEYSILKMLDGRSSLADIRREFEERFAPRRLTGESLQAFMSGMHRAGLLVSDSSGQGQQLLVRRRRERRRKLALSWTKILAIRFRGVDPEAFLSWLYPRCRWAFSAWFLAACVLLVVGATTLVAVEWRVVQSRLPDIGALVSPSNLPWLLVVLAVTKVLHELAHALACKHFGGECHEMGVMLLVFTPCLYCNVSDSWLLPSRWQRAAVAAAGIYVELVLASICTFLWWFTTPGLLNMLCLNTMLLCSISTILLNGNPLLRYDGYYILSDIIGVPNLAQESRAVLRRWLARLTLGLRYTDDRLRAERHRAFLAFYAVASVLYRWVVIIAIVWLLDIALRPYHLEILAHLVALLVVGGLVVGPITELVRFLFNPLRRHEVRRHRAWLTGATLAVVLAMVAWVPLPFRVSAPAVLQYENAQRVYVSVPGRLTETVRVGSPVGKGETLARLGSVEVEIEIAKLGSERDERQLHLRHLESRRALDPAAHAQIPAATEALASAERRLEQYQQDRQKLFLTAPVSGTVLPPPAIPREAHARGRLPTWSDTPLVKRNLGSYLETGTLFCQVGDPARLEALVIIDQRDLEFVRPGDPVRILLAQAPVTILEGSIVEIAKIDLDVAPRQLVAHGDLPTRTDRLGVARPSQTSYQARVSLDEHAGRLLAGTRCHAKILAAPQSLFQRFARYLASTFRLEL